MEDVLGNPALVALFGVVSLFLTSLLKRREWPADVKQGLALAVAVVFGVLAVAIRVEGEEVSWTVSVVVGHVAAVAVIAQGLYLLLINGSTGAAGSSPLVRLDAWLTDIGSKPPTTTAKSQEVKPPPGGISTSGP